MGKKIFKQFIPLIGAFLIAVIFFWVYNHYLLDASIANLKISLKELGKTSDLNEIKKITTLLNDSFLSDVAKGDFDLALAVKMELSEQLAEQVSKDARQQTKRYAVALSSAANIDFSVVVAEKISQETQVADIKHFIEKAVDKRIKEQPLLLSKLDDLVLTLFPGKRSENPAALTAKIKKIEGALQQYKGGQLQEKYLEIGKLCLLLKDWPKAKEYLNKSLQINAEGDTGIKTQFFLGIFYKATKDFKQASVTFRNIKSSLPKEWKYFASYQEADCLYRAGDTEKSVVLFKELFTQAPSLEIAQLAQFRAAYTYLYDLKEPIKAQEAFAVLKKEQPRAEIAPYIEHKINPDIAWHYCREGFRMLEEGYLNSSPSKYEKSLEQFDTALKIIPNHSTVFIGRALDFYFLNRPEEAINEGKKAKTVAPRNTTVIANLGFLYANLGMNDNAIEQYKEALRIYPSSDIYNYNLATLYALKKEYNKAETHFKKAIRLNANYAYAYNNLGYILWLKGSHREAKENFKKAVALKPDYTEAHYNLGIIHYVLGNYEEAKKSFINTEELQPQFRKTQWYLQAINKSLGYK